MGSTPTPTWSPTRGERASTSSRPTRSPTSRRCRTASLGGIFAAQVVEHLPPATLFRLLELARQKLRPGGLLVAETINPLSPLALRSYFADLTHAQPLVPETLALLAGQAGFRDVDIRYLNAPRHADDVDERIREILFAPLDYAIVART